MNKSARRCVFCTVSKHEKLDLGTFLRKHTSNSNNHNISIVFTYQLRLTNV